MIQCDKTNGKYYSDGVEITKEEYEALWKEWHDNLPEPAEEKYVPTDEEYMQAGLILLGGEL